MYLNCKTGQFSGTERGFGILKVPHGEVFSDESTLFGGECVIYMRTSVNKRILNVIIFENMRVKQKDSSGNFTCSDHSEMSLKYQVSTML